MSRTAWQVTSWLAVIAFVVLGFVLPELTTADDDDDGPITLVRITLDQAVRDALIIGYDVQEAAEELRVEEGCGPEEPMHVVTARTWWYVPITRFYAGCGGPRAVWGL